MINGGEDGDEPMPLAVDVKTYEVGLFVSSTPVKATWRCGVPGARVKLLMTSKKQCQLDHTSAL